MDVRLSLLVLTPAAFAHWSRIKDTPESKYQINEPVYLHDISETFCLDTIKVYCRDSDEGEVWKIVRFEIRRTFHVREYAIKTEKYPVGWKPMETQLFKAHSNHRLYDGPVLRAFKGTLG
jgi:hypothetical protein